ncbi:MAG TPA: phosphoribosylglycinamide formyltransferase [Pirellulales bacterium]|nr:phosphoribosylglycinamide formyltransferase [Pirellulales bacterium]
MLDFPRRSPLRLVVLISGGGTTLRNLLDQMAAGRLDARIELVISSNPSASGLEHAHAAGITTRVIQRRDHADDAGFGQAVFEACRLANPDIVVMGGFLKFVPIPPDFEWRVVNIHPALIPAFCGQGFFGPHVHQAVLDYGAKVSGCTVHFVDNQYDHGPILLQRPVPVLDGDTAETLAARVFAAECAAYPEALRWIASGRLRADGRRTWLSEP